MLYTSLPSEDGHELLALGTVINEIVQDIPFTWHIEVYK